MRRDGIRSPLSDQDISNKLLWLAGDARATECDLVLYLGEVKERQLYAQAGYSSLFAFCVQQLKFSEGTACRRIATARVVRKYPALVPYLLDGRLHIAAVTTLEKHLTPENHLAVFAKAAGRNKCGRGRPWRRIRCIAANPPPPWR